MDDLRELEGFIDRIPQKMSIGVAGVNISNNKVFLVKDTKNSFWSFPGGHLHKNIRIIISHFLK
jgi:8-oxo-dGTP pyrophosphatase MutT (NUDIX family)